MITLVNLSLQNKYKNKTKLVLERDTFPDLKAVLGKVVLGHTANALTDSVAEVAILNLYNTLFTLLFIFLMVNHFHSDRPQTWNVDNSQTRVSNILVLKDFFKVSELSSGEYRVGSCPPERSCQR